MMSVKSKVGFQTFIGLALALQAASHCALAQGKLSDIRISVGETAIEVELADNATSRDFLRQLPLTVHMTRSGEREYHGRPDAPISVDGPKQTRFENGDLGYWAPGGYLAIFLDKNVKPEIKDLIVMGQVTSNLSAIKRMGPSVVMTFTPVGPIQPQESENSGPP